MLTPDWGAGQCAAFDCCVDGLRRQEIGFGRALMLCANNLEARFMESVERYCYPAVFSRAFGEDIAVVFHDLDVATSGENNEDALSSARDLLGCVLRSLKGSGRCLWKRICQLFVWRGRSRRENDWVLMQNLSGCLFAANGFASVARSAGWGSSCVALRYRIIRRSLPIRGVD